MMKVERTKARKDEETKSRGKKLVLDYQLLFVSQITHEYKNAFSGM